MSFDVVAIGEVLWDVFPDERRPGGAPCNLAYHATVLGDRGAIVTRVGSDVDGEELTTFLSQRGVDVSCVQKDPDHPTGRVMVSFDGGQPSYDIVQDVAWDHIEPTRDALQLVAKARAVCYGTLVQRAAGSRHAVHELLLAAPAEALIVLDVNLRPPFFQPGILEASLRRSTVVKMNAAEVEIIGQLLDKADLVNWLVHDVGVQKICTTYGADGAAITTVDGIVRVPGVRIDTGNGDFVGVGDAFIAAMTHKLIRNAQDEEALRFANRYAALVATRRGAMPAIAARELQALSN